MKSEVLEKVTLKNVPIEQLGMESIQQLQVLLIHESKNNLKIYYWKIYLQYYYNSCQQFLS